MDKDFALSLLRVAVYLPLVLLLAYLTLRFGLYRFTGTTAGSGQLKVIEQVPLNNKAGIAVVRCGERYFLIGLGEGTPGLLTELPDYPETASATKEISTYSLQSIIGKDRDFKLGRGIHFVSGWLYNGWQRLKSRGS